MKKKRPVLQDVADRVGVTKMTVSRFLRNPEQVSVALRGKIAAALDELGYIPNRAPDILSNATSRAVGVLLPSLTNQVFAEVLRGIESVTDAFGYQTMLAHYGYKPELEEERLESMLSWNIDGLILTERTHTARTLKMIEVAGIPVVELMDSQSPCLDIAVGFDNFEAARQMTAAIIARGHRHIAYLGARLDERTIIKQKGYEQAMLDAGLTPYSVMVEQSSSYTSGIELMRQARREFSNLDGIFCTNDDLAVGVLLECQAQQYDVPGKMAIAGFHGLEIGRARLQKIASVITPRFEIGKTAADILIKRLNGKDAPGSVNLGYQIYYGDTL